MMGIVNVSPLFIESFTSQSMNIFVSISLNQGPIQFEVPNRNNLANGCETNQCSIPSQLYQLCSDLIATYPPKNPPLVSHNTIILLSSVVAAGVHYKPHTENIR